MAKKRVTAHNGRAGKNGVYSTKHNDRNFDTANSQHISDELVGQNWEYEWTESGITFDEAEKKYYEETFGDALKAKNDRYITQRHPERVQTIDQYRGNQRNCPEETIMQVGKRGDTIDAKMLKDICLDLVNWEKEIFPNIKVLDMALHLDEPDAAPHIHLRQVWIGHDKDGNLVVGQSKALTEMGIQPPHPEQKYGRHNNAKMTYTRMFREKFIEICRDRGLEIEDVPREATESGKDLLEFKVAQNLKELEQIEKEKKIAEQEMEQAQEFADLELGKLKTITRQVKEEEKKVTSLTQKADKLTQEVENLSDQREDLGEELETIQDKLEWAERKKADTEKNLEKLGAVADVRTRTNQIVANINQYAETGIDIVATTDEKKAFGKVKPATVTITKESFDMLVTKAEGVYQIDSINTQIWSSLKKMEGYAEQVHKSDIARAESAEDEVREQALCKVKSLENENRTLKNENKELKEWKSQTYDYYDLRDEVFSLKKLVRKLEKTIEKVKEVVKAALKHMIGIEYNDGSTALEQFIDENDLKEEEQIELVRDMSDKLKEEQEQGHDSQEWGWDDFSL